MGSTRWSVTGRLQGSLKKAEAGLATRAKVVATHEENIRILMDAIDDSSKNRELKGATDNK
jgi:hypothetical protein